MVKFSIGEGEEEMAESSRKKHKPNSVQINQQSTEKRSTEGEFGEDVRREDEGNNYGGITVRIDSDMLDCSICYEPLIPPLYQCLNGHVACSACRPKLQNKCHVCSLDLLTRNLALEKVLESIRIPCCYSSHGCLQFVPYFQKQSHESACLFGPSCCPFSDCTYTGFSGSWLHHFCFKHASSTKEFQYDQNFKVKFKSNDPFFILIRPDGTTFLLLKKTVLPLGYALSLAHLRNRHVSHPHWSYELSVLDPEGRGSNSMKARVTNSIKEWGEIYPTDFFLLVPSDFCSSNGELSVDVLIRRSA